jgi:hypothetical protein
VSRSQPLLSKDRNKTGAFNFPGGMERELQLYMLLWKLKILYNGQLYGTAKSQNLNAVLRIREVTGSIHNPEVLEFFVNLLTPDRQILG